MAQLMGQPFMPWQRHRADVVLEVDPATGLLVYRGYVIIVGRQCGKTSWCRSKIAHRAQGFGRAQHSVYTAQTADHARRKWLKDQVEVYQRSPLAELIAPGSPTLRLNNERLEWMNGSSHSPVTPSGKAAGTGDSLDEGFIDEAWVHEDATVESAMLPTMATRPQPQLGVLSTAKRQPKGQHSPRFAAYLRGKQREGRARVEAGIPSDIAFFDYSAPLDADPMDPETWWGCLPALGWTIDEKTIAAHAAVMPAASFAAEYLGLWEDGSASLWQVIGQARWAELADRGLSPGQPLAFAVDTGEQGRSAIGAAGLAAGGQRMCVEVTSGPDGLDHRPGTDWVVPRMVELAEAWNPCAVVVNPGSLSAAVLKPLRNAFTAAGLDPAVIKTPTVREVCEAFGQFHAAATEDRHSAPLRHGSQDVLDAAVAVATRRRVGAGMWSWDWESPGDVSPVVACTNAAWGATVFGPLFAPVPRSKIW